VTIKATPDTRVNPDKERRSEELALLALLVQALNPKVPLKRVNDSLRQAIDPDQFFDFEPGNKK
jgi:hypothetical protein